MTSLHFAKRFHILNALTDLVQYAAMQRARHLRVKAAYKETVKELSALTPRELTDVGIRPYDIPAIARASAEQIQ
jgi:uncharacterized protein YjiS (DUF1127 family)